MTCLSFLSRTEKAKYRKHRSDQSVSSRKAQTPTTRRFKAECSSSSTLASLSSARTHTLAGLRGSAPCAWRPCPRPGGGRKRRDNQISARLKRERASSGRGGRPTNETKRAACAAGTTPRRGKGDPTHLARGCRRALAGRLAARPLRVCFCSEDRREG